MRTLAVFVLALGLLGAASAQPSCRVYKTFNAVANTALVQDTIVVPDSFPVGSVRVSNLVLGHPDVSSLQLALMHRATANDAFTESALAAAKDQTSSFTPQAAINAGQPAAGQYVLRITDNQPGADGRVISLTSWTLELCQGTATAAPAPAATPAAPAPVAAASGPDNKPANATQQPASRSATDATNLMALLFPGFKTNAAPSGVLGAIHAVKDAGRAAATTHVGDVLKLVANQSEVYKTFVNKKISDTINGVNTAGTAAQGLITNRGSLLGGHDKSLRGFIANLKQYLAAETKDRVDAVLNSAGQLASLHGSLTGDFKSTAGAVAQLVVAGLSNMGQLYLTTEGAAKTHINNAITAKAAVLEAMLDKIIAGLTAAKGSQLTGPVVDLKLQLDVAKLQALAQALDKVDAAVKALPTPSAIVAGKVGLVGSLLQQTRVAELLSTIDDGPVMGALVAKVNTARDMLKKAVPTVAATGGNN